ncbi:MAG: extracellular solute-binding protein [Oscillospiraceae bacterium]|jgi:ABC-type glycerol-3-phosphate transport system substrate-binding protein|nr:extracellular solute-binding protein [Oscillospiraceae bacterium]
MIRKLLLLLSAVLILCSSLISCKGEDTPTADYVTIRTSLSLTNLQAYGTLLSEFSKSNTDIIIRDKSTTPSDAYKLGLSLPQTYGQENSPDIIFTDTASLGDSVMENFAAIDEIRATYPDFAGSIHPFAIACLSGGRVPAAVPVGGKFLSLFASRKLVAEADMPKMWEEVTALSQKLSGDGVNLFSGDEQSVILLFEQLCVQTTGKSVAHNKPSEEWLSALRMIDELAKASAFSNSAEDRFAQFNSGKIAMVFSDNQSLSGITDKDSTVCVFLPSIGGSGEKIMRCTYESGLLITKKAMEDGKKSGAVIALADYLLSDTNLPKLCEEEEYSALSAKEDASALEKSIDLAMREATKVVPSEFTGKTDFGSWSDVGEHLSELIGGLSTPEQALELIMNPEKTLSDLLVVSNTDLALPEGTTDNTTD